MYKLGDRIVVVSPPARFKDDNCRPMPMLSTGTVVSNSYSLVDVRLDNGFVANEDDVWPMHTTEIQLIKEGQGD